MQLKDAGYAITTMRSCGFDGKDLRLAGYTNKELKQVFADEDAFQNPEAIAAELKQDQQKFDIEARIHYKKKKIVIHRQPRSESPSSLDNSPVN